MLLKYSISQTKHAFLKKFVCELSRNESSTTSDALRSVLQVMKPVIASMPKAQRKQVSDALISTIRKANGKPATPGGKTYAALKNARRSSADAEDPKALGRKIMAARNVNMK